MNFCLEGNEKLSLEYGKLRFIDRNEYWVDIKEHIEERLVCEFDLVTKQTRVFKEIYNTETGEITEEVASLSIRQIDWILNKAREIYKFS